MRLTLIAVLLAAAACAPAINDTSEPATPPAAPPAAPSPLATPTMPKLSTGEHRVTYKVGGSASKALITYATPGGQEQKNGASVPWRRSFKAKDFSVLSLSAQNKGGGTISCEIDVDGKVKKRSSSSGAYAVVMCTASLGF